MPPACLRLDMEEHPASVALLLRLPRKRPVTVVISVTETSTRKQTNPNSFHGTEQPPDKNFPSLLNWDLKLDLKVKASLS